VLANWTTEERAVTVHDTRLGDAATVYAVGREMETSRADLTGGRISVTVPPLGCVLVVGAT